MSLHQSQSKMCYCCRTKVRTSTMADSASEMESDTSSVDGASVDPRNPDSLVKRVESLSQENRVLRMEIETLKLKNKTLQEENKDLRRASVNIVSTRARSINPMKMTNHSIISRSTSITHSLPVPVTNIE